MTKIYLIRIQEGKERENGVEKNILKKKVEKFPNLVKTNLHMQETQQTLSWINVKKIHLDTS